MVSKKIEKFFDAVMQCFELTFLFLKSQLLKDLFVFKVAKDIFQKINYHFGPYKLWFSKIQCLNILWSEKFHSFATAKIQ